MIEVAVASGLASRLRLKLTFRRRCHREQTCRQWIGFSPEIETNQSTTVALVRRQVEGSSSRRPKKSTATSDERQAWQRLAPGWRWSETRSNPGADCRCDCAWSDERA